MPFVGNAVGLHDANWRSNFGGSIYAYAGSHGCVNLPPEEAAELFSLINVGDTVYVHW
jgi:lipoprotein-anchoring transpeptidase ErfK/SrfK